MEQIYSLAEQRTVIFISQRLANVVRAGNIYVMESGLAVENGSHEELLIEGGAYKRLWTAQQGLENYTRGGYDE